MHGIPFDQSPVSRRTPQPIFMATWKVQASNDIASAAMPYVALKVRFRLENLNGTCTITKLKKQP